MYQTSYWFSFRSIINITFSFTNNHSTHQFINFFIKKFVFLVLLKNNNNKKIKYSQYQS